MGVGCSGYPSHMVQTLRDIDVKNRTGSHIEPLAVPAPAGWESRPDPVTEPTARRLIGPSSSVGEVVLEYLREQALAIRRADPLVRAQSDDAVHQMRVATRRMRSTLRTYARVLDRDRTRGLTDELRWLAGELGAARDLEVLRERLADAVAGLPDELVLGPVAGELTRHFARREATAATAAVAALDSERYLALLAAMDGLLADPPLTPRAARKASAALPGQLRWSARRLDARLRKASRSGPGSGRDRGLHEARKAAKSLRYALEAAAPALGRPAERLAKRAKSLQQVLGDHHDAVVARPVLCELAVQAHLDGGNGFTYGVLYQGEAARAQARERELPAAWRRCRKAAR